MNVALSQHRSDRHPVGLMVVVGLHVLVAAAMLTAKLHSPPAPPKVIELKPIDQPIKKIEPTRQIEPSRQVLPEHVIRIPDIKTDETSPIKAQPIVEDKPVADPTLVVARTDPGPAKPEAAHVAARRAVIDAGAAQCRPSYPAAAQRAGAEGTSRIRFAVDALGRVLGAQILQASGATREHRLLDKAAAEALAQCPVTPGVDEDGHPVGGTADVEYHWSLN